MRNPFAFGADPQKEEDPLAGINLDDLLGSNEQTDQYTDYLKNRPTHEEHKSSFGRKLGGGLLGAILGTDFGVTNAPYHDALQKWTDKGPGLKEGAAFEQKGNIQKRLGLTGIMTQNRAERRLALDTDKAKRSYDNDMKRISLIEDRVQREKEESKRKEQHWQEMTKNTEAYRAAIIKDRNKRTGLVEQRLNKGAEDKPLDANKQAAIDKQARKVVAADPRFGKWYNKDSDTFDNIPARDGNGNVKIDKKTGTAVLEEEMDEPTKMMLQAALVRAKERVAKMHRSNYETDAMWAHLGEEGNNFGGDDVSTEDNQDDPEMQYLLGEDN